MSDPQRVLVVQPSWVGDAVMATPALRALRERFPDAHIAYLMKRYVKPLYGGMPWADQIITYRTGPAARKSAGGGFFDLGGRLRAAKFDMGVLLPNSFKSALICKMAKIDRIVGYDRDGRGFLLTDKLLAPRDKGKWVPTPVLDYYMGLARYLGSKSSDTTMALFVTPSDRTDGRRALEACGVDPSIDHPLRSGGGPLVLLNPGAQYGAAKCWLPEHFAQTADTLAEKHNATVLVSGTMKDRPIIDAIRGHMRTRMIDLSSTKMSLGGLKEIVRRCDLMVTNDTGPRHIAAAFEVPVVTVFGPTDPRWTEIHFPQEKQVAVKVFCGPCQKKVCPLDHRCMIRVTPAMVLRAATDLLNPAPAR